MEQHPSKTALFIHWVVFQEPAELPKCKVEGPSNLDKHRQQQGLEAPHKFSQCQKQTLYIWKCSPETMFDVY